MDWMPINLLFDCPTSRFSCNNFVYSHNNINLYASKLSHQERQDLEDDIRLLLSKELEEGAVRVDEGQPPPLPPLPPLSIFLLPHWKFFITFSLVLASFTDSRYWLTLANRSERSVLREVKVSFLAFSCLWLCIFVLMDLAVAEAAAFPPW